MHISKHSHYLYGAYSQNHSRLPDKHVSKHSHKNLHTCWIPLSALQKKKGTVGTSTCAVAWAFTGDPQPRLFEFTSL